MFKPSTPELRKHGLDAKCWCKTGIARLWSYKENEGEEETNCCEPLVSITNIAKPVFYPSNVEEYSRANTGSFWG